MQVKYRLKLGQDEFEMNLDVKDEKDFFEQVSFYSNLPKAAPNGAADLKVSFRTTTKGHKYYSLVSESEKMEFKFGQNTENKGNGLFPKGWGPLYTGDGEDTGTIQTLAVSSPAVAPTVQVAPVKTPMPASSFKMPTPAATPAPQQAAAPVVVPTVPTTPSPQVTATANNVLARFGIPKAQG